MAESSERFGEPVVSSGPSTELGRDGAERLPLNRVVARDEDPVLQVLEPRDPVAYPTYKRRMEGAAHPIYQLGEEPMRVEISEEDRKVVSPKMELDIATFLQAVHAAFPSPRDPLVTPVLKARPAKAARPFLYVAEAKVVEKQAAAVEAAPIEMEAPYDPVLDSRATSAAVRGKGSSSGPLPRGLGMTQTRDLLKCDCFMPSSERAALASEAKR